MRIVKLVMWRDTMSKVTKIEVQRKNKERFNLYLDGVFEILHCTIYHLKNVLKKK